MRRRMWIACAVLTLALSGAGALAAGPSLALEPAWQDCNLHERLTHNYTPSQIQDSLAHMPADVLQYSNCYDVLHQALAADLAKLRAAGSGGSGGSFLPTPVLIVLVL